MLLCTEGTYPFEGGGVSTWCDILCGELPEFDFTVYAVTGGTEVSYRYELPPNVRDVVHIPLWGTREPGEYVLAGESAAALRGRRLRTTPDVVEAEFVPLLRRLLREMRRDEPDLGRDGGPVLWRMWRYFRRHDWWSTWKSRAAWRAFVEEMTASGERGSLDTPVAERPTVSDLTTAMQWLYNYLYPLSAPVPETDLVHTTIAGFPGLPGVVAACEHGTPMVVTEHGVWVRERYISIASGPFSPFAKHFLMDLSRHVARLNYTYARIVAPVSNFNVRWERLYGVAPEKIQTVYNGVDPGLFVPRPKPPHTAGRPVVVAAARIFPLKDIETMIRSAVVARAGIPDVRYLVYGSLDADPPYVERCRALIAELDLEETFVLAGHHNQPAALFAEGDISALSSISEGFPYTVLESMACGRPVVGTDVGGVREALEGFGIVVPPRDPEAFGQAVVRLLGDDDLRTRLGRQAREHVLAWFRTEHSIGSYRELYRRLDSDRRTAPQAVAS